MKEKSVKEEKKRQQKNWCHEHECNKKSKTQNKNNKQTKIITKETKKCKIKKEEMNVI